MGDGRRPPHHGREGLSQYGSSRVQMGLSKSRPDGVHGCPDRTMQNTEVHKFSFSFIYALEASWSAAIEEFVTLDCLNTICTLIVAVSNKDHFVL